MDVGNIFKSLFGIYKTTELLMQHHMCTHTTRSAGNNFSLLKVNKVQKVAARVRAEPEEVRVLPR